MNSRPTTLRNVFTMPNLLGLSLLIKLARYTPYPPFWDASSYLLMGKYLFSGGSVGLIEPFRPVVWPLLLGFLWKVGLEPISAGRVIVIGLGLGNIALIYAIGQRIFDRTTALLAAAFLAFSPTFFIWGNSLYTDIPASFLGLLSVYLFLRNRPLSAGAIGAIAFFTKFPQILPVAVVVGALSFAANPRHISRAFIQFSTAFILMSLPFLAFHMALYGNPLFPFFDGMKSYPRFLTSWPQGMMECLDKLLREECWIFVLALLEFSRFARGLFSRERAAILFAGLLSLLWVGKFGTDHHRLTITALPYLYLSSAAVATELLRGWKSKEQRIPLYVGLSLLLATVGLQVATIAGMRFPRNELSLFQKYIARHETDLRGKNLWVSSPKHLVFTNLRAGELIYDPTVNAKELEIHRRKLAFADVIFLDSRDLPCNPPGDQNCQRAKADFIARIKQEFTPEFLQENAALDITVGIFRRQ